MIDFACKKFNIDEIIRCSLGLSKSDYRLFNFLLYADSELTAIKIAEKNRIDRTTVQKTIKKLTEKNIVTRFQKNLEKGGYIFTYRIKDKQILKKNILSIIKNWSENAQNEIERW